MLTGAAKYEKITELLDKMSPNDVFKEFNSEIRKSLKAAKQQMIESPKSRVEFSGLGLSISVLLRSMRANGSALFSLRFLSCVQDLRQLLMNKYTSLYLPGGIRL